MRVLEFVRRHPHFFHTGFSLIGSSVSAICLGFAFIPLYQWLLGFSLAQAVYLSSMTFYLIFMFVFISSFAKKDLKALWWLNIGLSSLGLLTYLVWR